MWLTWLRPEKPITTSKPTLKITRSIRSKQVLDALVERPTVGFDRSFAWDRALFHFRFISPSPILDVRDVTVLAGKSMDILHRGLMANRYLGVVKE